MGWPRSRRRSGRQTDFASCRQLSLSLAHGTFRERHALACRRSSLRNARRRTGRHRSSLRWQVGAGQVGLAETRPVTPAPRLPTAGTCRRCRPLALRHRYIDHPGRELQSPVDGGMHLPFPLIPRRRRWLRRPPRPGCSPPRPGTPRSSATRRRSSRRRSHRRAPRRLPVRARRTRDARRCESPCAP